MREDSDGLMTQHLNSLSAVLVKEAEDKEPIQPGILYIAPPGYHLLIEENRSFSLSVDPKVNYTRPSIDVLFDSAADVYEDRVIGVILTGANSDGSRGLGRIKERGGLAIAQDPASAEAAYMPGAAINTNHIDHFLKLQEIGPFLRQFHVPK